MKLKSFDHMNCSLALTLDVIGERWTLLILREAFFGKKRFEEFQKSLGIARNILSSRLNRLVSEGILEKRPVEARRFEYVLTQKGPRAAAGAAVDDALGRPAQAARERRARGLRRTRHRRTDRADGGAQRRRSRAAAARHPAPRAGPGSR